MSEWIGEDDVFKDLREWWDHILGDLDLQTVDFSVVMSKQLAERHSKLFSQLGAGAFEYRCIPHNDIRVESPDASKCWRGWTQDEGPKCRMVQTLVWRVGEEV